MTKQGNDAVSWLTTITGSGLLVVLPVAHLLVASTYSWGWMAGFGANVSVLADPRDLFAVSISKLVWVYAVGLFLPVAQHLMMSRRFGAPYGGVSDPQAHAAPGMKAIPFILWGVLIVTLMLCLHAQSSGKSQAIFLLTAANVAGLIAYKFLIDYIEFEGQTFRLANFGVGLLAASIGFGLADGNWARYATYKSYAARLPHCGKVLVQRRFGEFYVTIAKDDAKVVVDLKCEPVMRFPSVSQAARPQITWSPYPQLRYVPVRNVGASTQKVPSKGITELSSKR